MRGVFLLSVALCSQHGPALGSHQDIWLFWSALLYHTLCTERFGRGTNWYNSLPSLFKHAFPCSLLPAACMKHFWGGGFDDRALELFVWLPLYYDRLPFYKYYLNIMMRNKNKTKILTDEREKSTIHSSSSGNKRTKQFWVCIIDCSCTHRLVR